MTDPEPDDSESELAFGQILIERGLVRPEQIQECLREQATLSAGGGEDAIPTLAALLVRKGYITISTIKSAMHPSQTSVTQPSITPPGNAPVTERVGKYLKKNKIGQGGMGEVWKAWDTELNRWVALKFLLGQDAEEISRFRREAQLAARLNHANIAAIYEAGENYIAMQFVQGATLASIERPQVRWAAEVIRQAALAVHFAHQQGIVHRDLKPANLMVENDRVFVMDFGLAKTTDIDSSISRSGSTVGTPHYMSPEQARGLASLDCRSDVYSLGATLYTLLAGRPPFDAPHVPDVLARLISDEPPPLRKKRPEVDEDLETIVLKCLEKDPNRRYRTAKELADDLSRWLSEEAIVAHPPSTLYRMRKGINRNPWAWSLAMVALLAVVAGAVAVGFVLRKHGEEKQSADRIRRAERLYESGEYDNAQKVVDEVLAGTPADAEARYWRARLAVRRHQLSRGFPEVRIDRGVVTVLEEERLRIESEAILQGLDGYPMVQGLLRLGEGKWDEALLRFRAVPRDAPGSWEAEFYAGIVHYLKGEFEPARELLSKHDKRDRERTLPVWIRSLLASAQVLEQNGRDASALFEQARTACQDLRGGNLLEAQVLVAAGSWETRFGGNAEEKFKRAIDRLKEATSPEAYGALGDAWFALAGFRRSRGKLDRKDPGEYREAIVAYGRAEYGRARVRRAQVRFEQWAFLGGPADALLDARKDYEDALEENRESIEAALGLAQVTQTIEQLAASDAAGIDAAFRKEIETLDRLLEKRPKSARVLRARAQSKITLGVHFRTSGRDPYPEYEGGIRDYTSAIALHPNDAESYRERGLAWQNLAVSRRLLGQDSEKEYEEALADFGRALEIHSRNAVTYQNRGVAWHNLAFHRQQFGRDTKDAFEEAFKDFDRSIAINDSDAETWYERGRARGNRAKAIEEHEAAIRDFDKALELNPSFLRAFRERARSRQNLAAQTRNPIPEFVAAARDLEIVVTMNPRDGDAFRTRGAVLQNLGQFRRRAGEDPTADYETAVRCFDEALQINSKDFEAYHGRGMTRGNLAFFLDVSNRESRPAFDAALADFTEALKLNEKYGLSWRGRGLAWQNVALSRVEPPEGRVEALLHSESDFTRATECNPRDAEAWLLRADTRLRLAGLDEPKRRDHARNAISDYERTILEDPRLGQAVEQGILEARKWSGE